MAKQAITEESGIHKQWYEQAQAMKAADLPAFIDKLINDYEHDYGTICHAVAAAGIAAMYAVNHSDAGGITGFQAGCITWEILRHWQHIEGPARIIEYNDMCYPQYADRFCTISQDVWEAVQKFARENLELNFEHMHPEVKAHMERVIAGEVPFGYSIEG